MAAPSGVSATDTAAIQGAIDSLNSGSGNGGIVRLQAGEYVVGTLIYRSKVGIVGAGTRATTLTCSDVGSVVSFPLVDLSTNGSFVDAVRNERWKQNSPSGGIEWIKDIYVDGHGDNATFLGVGGYSFVAADSAESSTANKGVLYAANFHVKPSYDRNNSPDDDATPVLIGNDGTGKATDALYFERNSNLTQDFGQVIQCDARSDHFIRSNGNHAYGLNLAGATITVAGMTIQNNIPVIQVKDHTGSLKTALLLNSSDVLELYGGVVKVSATGAVTLNGGAIVQTGSGSPEGSVTAPVGSLFLRSDGGAATSLYVKESGTGNTGWVGK